MKLREWLETKDKNESVTFIVAKSVKDEGSPFYDDIYTTVPMRSVWEWLQGESIDKYIVIKAEHPPIDVTGSWQDWYKAGRLKCCMVTTEESLYKRYSEKQAKDMIGYYDREVRK